MPVDAVLMPSVVPACTSRRYTSLAKSSTSPGTRLDASEANATNRPSALTAGEPLALSASPPALLTLTRCNAPVERSSRKASLVKFVSPATRLSAYDANRMNRPSGLIDGCELSPFASVLRPTTVTRSVVPAARSRTKMSAAWLRSLLTRFVADEANATNRPSALIAGRPKFVSSPPPPVACRSRLSTLNARGGHDNSCTSLRTAWFNRATDTGS